MVCLTIWKPKSRSFLVSNWNLIFFYHFVFFILFCFIPDWPYTWHQTEDNLKPVFLLLQPSKHAPPHPAHPLSFRVTCFCGNRRLRTQSHIILPPGPSMFPFLMIHLFSLDNHADSDDCRYFEVEKMEWSSHDLLHLKLLLELAATHPQQPFPGFWRLMTPGEDAARLGLCRYSGCCCVQGSYPACQKQAQI